MGERPTQSETLSQRKRPKGRYRTLVETSKGKRVLSSDARMHLEKLQRQKKKDEEDGTNPEGLDEVDEELKMLEKERRILAEKIKRKNEIMRLQKEFSDVSEGRTTSEY